MLEEANAILSRISTGQKQPFICLLTGSSGCGKTYLGNALAQALDPKHAQVYHFDHIGVPSPAEMIRTFGCGEKWQESTTHEWLRRMAQVKDKALVVLEGQFHPSFAVAGCVAAGVEQYCMVVVTCDEAVWKERLRGPRQQPMLITEDMRNWARLLREETVKAGGSVIDTSASDISHTMQDFANMISPFLLERAEPPSVTHP
jgi:energy-coupling factor transporter ATP-binding protein EcfA2